MHYVLAGAHAFYLDRCFSEMMLMYIAPAAYSVECDACLLGTVTGCVCLQVALHLHLTLYYGGNVLYRTLRDLGCV